VLVAVAATPPVPAAGADGEPAAVLVRDHEGAIIERRGPERLMNVVDGRVFASAPDGFWQVHPAAASTLVEAVLSNVEVRAGETVWDLYAGAGLFSASLARHAGPAGTVIAVEGSAAAAADARTNLDGVPGVRVERARVDRWLQGERDRPDVVVLDPPRKGATRAVVGPVARARPRVVAYVACDPAALARDVALFAAAGYELDVLRAFDLFPMTHHVECVAILRPTVR
jgi:tRNA/tmRNA/rRNA uracil-C5-methylase (TrmA/RlmC/RlmD family)